MATIFDTLDQQAPAAAPASNVGAPTSTIFDSLPGPTVAASQTAAGEPGPAKTVFDSLPSATNEQLTQQELRGGGYKGPTERGQTFWDSLNSPLFDFTRPGAGPIETGGEKFASSFTSPASIALAVGSFGGGALEQGLVKLGLPAEDAAAYVLKTKLAANFGFLAKYGYDTAAKTYPELEMNWGDYRAAKTPADKKAALDRLEELGTEATLGALATGLATKGVASDVAELRAGSGVGRAMLQEQYRDSVFALSAKKRAAAGEADAYEKAIEKAVPDAARQAAIYHNIEALGDPAKLEERAVKAEEAGKPELAKEIRSGKELSEPEKTVRTQVQEIMQMNGNDLRASGRLPAESESAGYLPHKYAHEFLDPVTKKPVPGLAGGEGFLQKRLYDNIVDAEIAGLAPIKNLAGLVADYHENAGYVLAKDKFAETLAQGRTNDGAPMAAPQQLRRGGVLGAHDTPMYPGEAENLQKTGQMAQLVQSGRVYEQLNEETGEPEFLWRQTDYEPSGAPYTVTGLNVWRDGSRVPLALNPEIAPHAQNLLERPDPSPLMKFALKASSGAKSALLSLSPFHWDTMANRMFELMKNPLAKGDIDFLNPSPELQEGMRDGLMLGGRGMGRAAEGLVPSKESFINKIPLVGGLNKLIEENLFGSAGYISGLKVRAYGTLRDAIQKSYPSLSPIEAGRIAASQVNNKFGGLNYDVLGRGANNQNALRLMLLAPDFLESTGRSILDLAGDHGAPLLKRFVAFQAAHWTLARAVNYMISGDTHPEAGFSVYSKDGKREYSLRTTMGDFLHFVEKPMDFVANRMNPLGRAAAETFYGYDPQGHKVTPEQQFFDALRQITPIGAQGIYPNQQVTQPSAADKALQSFGVQARKKFSPAETLAHELETKRSGEGAPLEGDDLARAQLRYRLEDSLRTAIVAGDQEGRLKAVQQVHQAKGLTEREGSEIIRSANKYPLPIQSTVAHLSLADALQVWDKASLTEKRAVRRIVQEKIERWQRQEHTPRDSDTMRQQIQAFRFSLAE